MFSGAVGAAAQHRWSPNKLGSSLLAWWDAEVLDTLALASGAVTSWKDRIGGITVSQATTANKPAWSASSVNSRPGITFDGSTSGLAATGVTGLPTGATPSEVWTLASQLAPSSEGSGDRRLFELGASFNTHRMVQKYVSSGVTRLACSVGTGTAAAVAVDSTTAFDGLHVVRSVFGADTLTVSLDGDAGASAAAVPASDLNLLGIGCSRAGVVSGGWWQGVINTILITAPLSTGDAASMLAFLKARGGIA